MNKQRKTSHILNVFQYDADGHVVLPASLTLGIVPGAEDNSGKVPSTAWVRGLVSTTGSSLVPTNRSITINGTSYDLSSNRSWSIDTGVLTASAGSGISVSVVNQNLNIVNTGLLTGTAGAGISVSTVNQNLNIVNTGLLTGTAGAGISVSTVNQNLNIVNTGILTASAGAGVSLSVVSQNLNIINTGILTATAGAGISLSVVSGNLNIVNTITDNNQLTNGAGYATTGYVSTQINNLVAGAPGLLDTLDELAAALGDDANFATTTATSLGNRLRVDTATQGLTSTQQGYGRTNLGLGTAALSATGDFATAVQGTKADTAHGWGNHASAGYLTTSSAASTYVSLTGSYANPSWITSLAYSKITGVPAFLTSYTETDTLATVTARGASTTAGINVNGRVTAAGGGTYAVTGSSSQRYIMQALNTSNSVNSSYGWWWFHNTNGDMGFHADAVGDILTLTRAGGATINGNTILTAGNYSSYTYSTSDADSRFLRGTTNPGSVNNFTISIGNNGSYSYVQSHSGQPLHLNPVGNSVFIGSGSTVLHSSNYNSYSPTLTGGGASGTWGISITGNAATVGGYSVSGSVGANTVVIRDSNGYIFANYINSNVSESENPTINSFFTSNGDGYLRKSNLAHVRSQLGNYGGWITSSGSISGNAATATYATNATRLYASDGSYVYGGAAPYYMTMTYDGSRWLLQVTPGTPAAVRVSYADSAGSASSASTSSQVTINYNNDSNSTYQLLWGSGNSVYGTAQVYVNPSSDIIYARGGYISPGNAWGTSDSAFFPNGITTAGGTNWVYGLTYLGNAPGNGSGVEVAANGRIYVRANSAAASHGFSGLFVDRNNGSSNYVPWSFENEYGNHSWGLVARFHITNGVGDRPSIQFSHNTNNTRWSIGYVYPDDNFRITQNHGMRPDNSTNDGWGTERFRINTDGNTLIFASLGIGSVTPDVRLSVNGDAHVANIVYLGGTAGSVGSWGTRTYGYGGDWTTNARTIRFDNVGYGTSWSLTIDTGGNVQSSASMRAPIFYDSNDTGYYLDPNGTSNLQTWTADTAARLGRSRYWTNRWAIYGSANDYMTGTNGWGTEQGNWDNAWKGGFSGWDIWGTGTAHPQGGGYIHAQGIISGQHAAASDGSSAYGWMMVGAHNATENRYWLRGKWGGSTSGWVEMITTGNIGSQSVNYASSAGSANSVAWSNVSSRPTTTSAFTNDSGYITSGSNVVGLYSSGWGNGNFTWYQSPGGLAPYGGGWASFLVSNHGNGSDYYNQTIIMPFWGVPQYSRREGGPNRGPWTFWTEENYNPSNHGGNYTANGFIRVNANNNLYLDYNHGQSIVGVYSSYRYQGVYSMGDAYKLAIDGTTPGNLYGMSWSHPNAGGQASRLNDHGLMVMINGVTQAAISSNIWAAGDVTAFSDARVKDNIEVINNAVEKIQAIRGVTFTRNDMTDTTTRHAGVIAQEVMEVLPEVITKDANDHYSVAYGNLNALLIEAIKEQQKQIEELQNKLDNVLSSR